jgi:hypothetical protein
MDDKNRDMGGGDGGMLATQITGFSENRKDYNGKKAVNSPVV